MNERSDMDRVLRHWFADGPSEMPDRVVETVADRIGRQRQRRASRLPWRPYDMNSTIKIGTAIAAVFVLAVVGWNLLPGRPASSIGQPSSSPSPSATASQSPTPSPTPRSAQLVVQQKNIAWTADVPVGWVDNGWFLASSQGTESPTGIAVGAPGANYVPTDPCDGVGKNLDGQSVADVVAALEAREDLVVSNKVDTTLGGYSGTRVDIQAPADPSAYCGEDLFIIMAEPGGAGYHVEGPSETIQMWIVDVEGVPTVFQITSFAGTPPGDLAAAQQIVDSIVITPWS
jgi:hypothetical protein